ncbi:hypothetical protein EYF80_015029 [Liparis tanakae]|uniref:Uncharacterized protein n=1 Tax=Liparis tanakae TaxID=230148 RepID=A0A4Z2IAC3_9TELE|nr:hypothetical protein EYF80_015029 [Liparis tanakae]
MSDTGDDSLLPLIISWCIIIIVTGENKKKRTLLIRPRRPTKRRAHRHSGGVQRLSWQRLIPSTCANSGCLTLQADRQKRWLGSSSPPEEEEETRCPVLNQVLTNGTGSDLDMVDVTFVTTGQYISLVAQLDDPVQAEEQPSPSRALARPVASQEWIQSICKLGV